MLIKDIKRGLVLGGGGSRGAYQVGCWRAMQEAGMTFDVITGTSVGALNGGMMVQGDLQPAWDFWSDMDVSLILSDMPTPVAGDNSKTVRAFVLQFLKNGGADSTPLQKVVDRLVDEKRMRASGIDFGIVAVDMRTGKPAELLLKDMPEGSVTDYMLASATCFPAFRPKEIDDSLYIDGGYYDNLPLALLLKSDRQIDEIWCIDIKGWGFTKKIKTPVPVHTVTSYWDLGEILVFEKNTARRNLTLGYNDMRKRLELLDGYAYTFEKGDADFMEITMAQAVEKLLAQAEGSGMAALDKLASDRLSAAIEERSGKKRKPTRGELILSAAELAGEALGVSPEPVYSLTDYHLALKSALEGYRSEADELSLEQLRGMGARAAVAALKKLAGDVPLLLTLELVRLMCSGNETPVKPEAVMLASPKRFLAAIYLAALENSDII